MTVIVVATTDEHINSLVGLCPPVYRREKAAEHHYSPAQEILWDKHCEFWAYVTRLKRKFKCEVWSVHLGDLGDINFHNKVGLISLNENDIVGAVGDVLEPARAVYDRWFLLRGTAAHTRQQAQLDERIAKEFHAEPDESGYYAWWNLSLLVEGKLFNCGHHPHTAGHRPWTRQQAAERQSEIILSNCARQKRTVPDVVLRGHCHYFADSGTGIVPRTFFVPAWSWPDSFSYRLGAGEEIEPIGGLIFICKDGGYEMKDWRWAPEEVEPWQPK